MSQPCSSILLIVIKYPVLINVRVDAAQVLSEFAACVEVYPGIGVVRDWKFESERACVELTRYVSITTVHLVQGALFTLVTGVGSREVEYRGPMADQIWKPDVFNGDGDLTA